MPRSGQVPRTGEPWGSEPVASRFLEAVLHPAPASADRKFGRSPLSRIELRVTGTHKCFN